MTARHYYRNDEGTMEAVDTVLRWAWAGSEKANEGEAGTWEVAVDDPDMILNFVGHRRWIVYEDESDDENQVLVDGITQGVRIAHAGGEVTNPDGRVWIVEIADLNALWQYRLMTGSDSQFDEQTDVERILQIANSEEMGYFDDLSFVSAGNTVTMDEMNGRGQFTGQIADAAAQATGKNYWIGSVGNETDGTDIFLWYDRDSSTEYTSPLSLSNDPADLDMPAVNAGTATTYPLGADTELRRDYARQYSGAYGELQKGAKYIPDDENPYNPGITLSGRDIPYPAPEIKTKAKMKARLLRVLRDHATPDEVIKTTITLPANKVTQLRRGMRVRTKATHEPGYEDGGYLRVLSAQPKPIGRKYEVAIELQGPTAAGALFCSTALAALELSRSTGSGSPGADTITPTVDGQIVGIVIGSNQNTTMDPAGFGTASGYTTLKNVPLFSRTSYRVVTKAGSSGVGSSMSMVIPAPGLGAVVWNAIQVLIPTGATSPVQDAYVEGADTVNLASPPTVGNLLLVFSNQDFAGHGLSGPGAGWTPLFDYDEGLAEYSVAGYAKCAEEGDGTEYQVISEGNFTRQTVYLMEWEIS